MALDIFTPVELIQIQQDPRFAIPDGFWSGVNPTGQTLGVFNQQITFETQKIYFDQIPVRDRRIAPFVAPNVQGRVMRNLGANLASFAPAYTKPKHVVDPSQAIPRRAGDPLGLTGGNPSLEQKFDAIVANNLRLERVYTERRWDWMCCTALAYGAITIVGEDYPSVTVDFQRDGSLTFILTGNARWDQTGTADPLSNIKDARMAGFELGQAPVDKFIFGLQAWELFIADPKVQALLNVLNRGGTSTFSNVELGMQGPVEYKGFIQGAQTGRVDLWVYNNQYEDVDGTLKDYIDTRDVIGVGNNVQGYRCYGAIMDKRAGLKALPMFPKMWDVEDPSVTYTMTQSAPLMVPGNPNNTLRIRVTDTVF